MTISADVFSSLSDSKLFERLNDEMKRLTVDKLPVLLRVLEPLRLWRHERKEIVTLCCGLLKDVVGKHDAETVLARDIIYCLCQIAFRDLSPATALSTTPLDPETLDRLVPFVKNGRGQFLDDLVPALSSFSWEEKEQQTIIQMILDRPVASLSPSCLSAAITVIGRARWSVVEAVDHDKMLELLGRLLVTTLVDRMIADDSVCPGWMRLLLLYTCPRTEPSVHSRQSLWCILLALIDRTPRFFPLILSNHLTGALLGGLGTNLEGLDRNESAEIIQKRQVLWAKLLWSSRFFESDCKSWADFEIATTELVREIPVLRKDLPELGAALEKPDLRPSLAYSKIIKICNSVIQDTPFPLRPSPVFTESLPNATPPGNPPPRSNPEVGGSGEVGDPSPKPPKVAAKDTPPITSLAPNNDPPHPQSILTAPRDITLQDLIPQQVVPQPIIPQPIRPQHTTPQHIAPQETPPFDPGRGRRRPRSVDSSIGVFGTHDA